MSNSFDLDKEHIWHPCSQMKDYESYPARVITRGKGVWLYQENGHRLLDAISSWWTNIFGHSNRYIARAVAKQARTLPHVIMANYTHPQASRLAGRLAGLFDGALSRVFFTDNGSSSVEVALKMSYHYWYNTGRPEKRGFAYLKGSYHGETLGSLSVGSLDAYKKVYQPLLPETVEIDGPACYRCLYGKERETCGAECFAATEKVLTKNKKTLASVIVEPIVQGAAGMRIYSPRYLAKLRDLCTNLGIHLVCDEIAVGFGRTGRMMASSHAGVVPDFVTVSKAITSGTLPLAAVLTSEKIYKAFYADYTDLKAFIHSHTYSGNPIACAAANAVFDIFESKDIIGRNEHTGRLIRNSVNSLADHPNVGEIRSIGMITAIELVQDKKSKEPFDWKKRIGHSIYRTAEKRGVLLRSLGDVIYFIPPYIIKPKEIEFMTRTAIEAIHSVLGS
jgi:adenosylmethionine-8-amino-7-oxononanoate aminotransferase